MKKLIFLAFVFVFTAAYSQYSVPTASPRQKMEQQFSLTKISVDYGRPGVKGRKIFGELVPYGQVWRAGANAATKITFDQNVNFGGTEVPAGSYGLFVIPTEKEWKFILNKDANQWGAYSYDAKLNVAEIAVPVQKTADKQEWLSIALTPVDIHSTNLVLSWDTLKASVLIKESKPEAVAKIIEKLTEIRQIEKAAAEKK